MAEAQQNASAAGELRMITRLRKALTNRLPNWLYRSRKAPSLEGSKQTNRGHKHFRDAPAFSYTQTLPYPHFIIIGAPKCGTSWLRGTLDEHPRVRMVPDEIEYFSDFLDQPVEWYTDHFATLINGIPESQSSQVLLGEKSARYCSIEPEQIALVGKLLPEARLILMVRDPVARHWAHTKRHFQKARHDKYGGGVLSLPRDELFRFFRRTRRFGEFSQMISNWTAVFPSKRLLVLSQEKTLAAPKQNFDAVLQHIGLSGAYNPAAIPMLYRKENSGPSIEMPDDIAAYLEDMFAAERERLGALLGCDGKPLIEHA